MSSESPHTAAVPGAGHRRVDDRVRGAMLALSGLGSFGPARLWRTLEHGDPVGDLAQLRVGRVPAHLAASSKRSAAWSAAANSIDERALLARHRDHGLFVRVFGDDGFPTVHPGDVHVPPMLIARGLDGAVPPRSTASVGIVGTRRATRYGRDVARAFARDLSESGCSIVSGLATGIDAAAHWGAIEAAGAPPVAVIGSGHDVVYPRSNAELWVAVATSGAIVSEYPLGTAPAPWRFPARNRILVALCDLLVVVESHDRGGSLITAGIAGERGVPVLAVPGSIRSSASAGTNALISDGCQPCLSVDDVLAALSLATVPAMNASRSGDRLPDVVDDDAGRVLDADARCVLDAVGWEAASFDMVVRRCPSMSIGRVATALVELCDRAALDLVDGWYQRTS